MSAKCLQCGSAAVSSDYPRAFECGTLVDRHGTFHHTTTCRYFFEFRKPLDAHIKRLEDALTEIELVMKQPALNHRLMQIAGPARQVINIIKKAKEAKP